MRPTHYYSPEERTNDDGRPENGKWNYCAVLNLILCNILRKCLTITGIPDYYLLRELLHKATLQNGKFRRQIPYKKRRNKPASRKMAKHCLKNAYFCATIT